MVSSAAEPMGEATGEGTSRTIKLKDGRTLGYGEYGDSNGKPVFYFHGWPGARNEWQFLDAGGDIARRHGARIIAADRPGYGLSDFKPNHILLDWMGDVTQLAAALGIERFAILAYSGGVPPGFACAYQCPERLTALSCMAVFAPFDTPGVLAGMAGTPRLQYRLARYAPWLYRFVNKQMVSHPDQTISGALNTLPAPDAAVMADPDRQRRFLAVVAEGARQNGDGGLLEGKLNSSRWGFPLDAIRVPVFLWQGEKDTFAPPAMARYLAGVLPDVHSHFEPNDGHISIAVNHLDSILDELLTR